MKVRTNTDTALTLDDRPWFLGAGITLAALVALGFGMSYLIVGDFGGAILCLLALGMCLMAFVAFVRRTMAFLDRGTGRVVVRVASVFGETESGAALADVRGAEVDTKVAVRSKDRDTHRPVLRLADGKALPLREVFISGGGAAETVDLVNGWLARG